MPTWVVDRHRYQELARGIDPAVRLVTKDGWLWRVLAWLLLLLSLGLFSRERFLLGYATTVGPIQAYPREFPALSEGLIVHESRHTVQSRWFGLCFHPWVGLPLFGLFYLFLPVPILFAYFRYRFELDADKMRWRYELINKQRTPNQVRERAEERGRIVSGVNYFFAWPRPLAVRGFKRVAEKVIRECGYA